MFKSWLQRRVSFASFPSFCNKVENSVFCEIGRSAFFFFHTIFLLAAVQNAVHIEDKHLLRSRPI